jgi:hypothetical protein
LKREAEAQARAEAELRQVSLDVVDISVGVEVADVSMEGITV